jgi:hypothetical protein
MASFRKPKGTYIRSTGDWFSGRLSSGAWYVDVPAANSQYLWIGLYNNSTRGSLFYVLTISAAMDGANVMAGVVQKGPIGAKVADCVSANPSLGAGSGQIFMQQTGALGVTTPQAIPANTAFLIGTSFGSPQFTPAHPVCILPAGYSCTIVSDFATADGGASFWFVPLDGD